MRRITLVAVAVCIAAGAPVLADEDSQGFLRVVEGAATLIRVEDGQPEAARENTPALAGDRLSLAPGSRVEVILPDGHRLRLAESADLELVALARSLDENSAATALQLSNGALAIDVPREAVDRTRVDTEAAAVLLERGGLYLVEIDQRGATRVVVREGEAEVLTEYDTTLVRAGDEALIDPESRARVALYQAPPLTDVEEWARQLEAEAEPAQVAPVEPELRYAAQPLGRYGSWVDAGAGYAWRPRVEVGWRPYWRGYWKYSPAGLVWCSYEPWGWVPYHYGSWDLHPSHGWLWYPGAVYRPAHVVWYWGPSYTGWVPSGYYGSFYARRFGFHASFGSGFYGVSYAGWNAYRDWVFCPTRSIGYRYQYRYHGDYRVLDHHGRFNDRAFITADTSGLDRDRWRDSTAVEETLVRRAHRRTGGGGDLPDLSAVVARSPEVSGTMLRELGSGDDGRQVAVHRRPGSNGDTPGPAEQNGQTVGAETPSTRIGPRRPAVLADDGVARRVPGPAKGAEPGSPADAGRTAVRAHRSPGVETLSGVPEGTVVRDRAGQRSRTMESPTPEVQADDGGGAVRTRRPVSPEAGAGDGVVAPPRMLRRASPGVVTGRAPYDEGLTQRRTEVVRQTQAPAPPDVEAPPAQRLVQPRDYQTPSTEPRARAARPQVEQAAPQPQAEVERSYAPRAVPSAQSEPSYAPRSAPRVHVEQSYTPRTAPAARVERSYTPRLAPPGQSASSESRGGYPAASAAPSAPRSMESPRPAESASESRAASSESDGGGSAHARDDGGGQGARGGGGRGHASRPH